MVLKCISVVYAVVITIVPYNIDKDFFVVTKESMVESKIERNVHDPDEAMKIATDLINDKDYKCRRFRR